MLPATSSIGCNSAVSFAEGAPIVVSRISPPPTSSTPQRAAYGILSSFLVMERGGIDRFVGNAPTFIRSVKLAGLALDLERSMSVALVAEPDIPTPVIGQALYAASNGVIAIQPMYSPTNVMLPLQSILRPNFFDRCEFDDGDEPTTSHAQLGGDTSFESMDSSSNQCNPCYIYRKPPKLHTLLLPTWSYHTGVSLSIVEYVKPHASLLDKGIFPHLKRLLDSMQSALIGRKELQPVFGLLAYEAAIVMTVIGYIRGNQFCSKMSGHRNSPMFRMNNSFDVLALYMIILNSRSYAQQISKAEVVNIKVRPIPCGSPGHHRAYLGSFPVLIDDQSNRFEHEADSDERLSDPSKSWLSLFVCCDVPAQLDVDAHSNPPRFPSSFGCIGRLDQSLRAVSRPRQRVDHLGHEHLQVYDSLRTEGLVKSSAEPDQTYNGLPVSSLAPKIHLGLSSKLKSCVRSDVWTDIRFRGPSIVELQCCPSMHRRIKSNTIVDEDLTQIVPDAAFFEYTFRSSSAEIAPGSLVDGDEISYGSAPRAGIAFHRSGTSCGWLLYHGRLLFGDLATELPEKYDVDLVKPIDVLRQRWCMRNVWNLAHEIERLELTLKEKSRHLGAHFLGGRRAQTDIWIVPRRTIPFVTGVRMLHPKRSLLLTLTFCYDVSLILDWQNFKFFIC
ncbi:hypothetical protein DFS33DRAFT_1386769 [Desarmillaria ectypa]|nr:hypothetical protein DFS33DRAFT_1386769 [Desarmillaria ectypa]